MLEDEEIPPEKLVVVSEEVDDSYTESDDLTLAVDKSRRNARVLKPTKIRSVKPRKKGKKNIDTSKRKRMGSEEPSSNYAKGPGSTSKKGKVEKEFTRTERVNVLKTQKVLNGWVFDPEIFSKPGMPDLIYVVELQDWMHLFEWGVPTLYERKVREFYCNIKFWIQRCSM